MPYMKKDINFGLLILIIATLIAFTGFTIYYRTSFFNLTEDYKEKLNKIDSLVTTLNLEKSKLNETSYELKLKKEREQDLGTKYSNIKSIKEQLEVDKARLQKDLANALKELASTKLALTQTKTELASTQELANQYETERDSYKSQRDSCRSERDSYLAQCQALGGCS